ncbi:MAG: hypothetical protein VYE40_13780 [Myxococcota bacterium]|nr:hypothetical protein [Myxococcota bacterium]
MKVVSEHVTAHIMAASVLALAAVMFWAPGVQAQEEDPFEDEFGESSKPATEEVDEPVREAPPEARAEAGVEEESTSGKGFASGRLRVGGRIGGSYNQLSRPTDPAGEPTLLYGSVFSGPGFVLGAQASFLATSSSYLDILLELGLLYGFSQGTGYAESIDGTQRQTIQLRSHGVRVPLLLRLGSRGEGRVRLSLLAGPELLLGLASSATVTNEGIEDEPQPLYTKPVTHLGLSAGLGLNFNLGKVRVPLDFRLTWDPMMPGSTRERFEDFQDLNNPGTYQVGFDTQLLFLLGVEYAL